MPKNDRSSTANNASVVSSGIVQTQTLGANSYSVFAPTPTFTNNGPVTISGTYPNYTVASTANNASVVSSGIVQTATLGANSYSVYAPTPTFTNSGPVAISGTYPNYTVSSTANNASVVSSGIVQTATLGANSY